LDSAGPTEVGVDFEDGEHRSKFSATWSDGELDVDMEEEGEDGDD